MLVLVPGFQEDSVHLNTINFTFSSGVHLGVKSFLCDLISLIDA